MNTLLKLGLYALWTLVAFWSLMAVVMVTSVLGGDEEQLDASLFFVISDIAFFVALFKFNKFVKAKQTIELETMILNLAHSHNGHLTATELAAQSDLTFTQATQALDDLFVTGACTKVMNENLVNLYEFKEISGR